MGLSPAFEALLESVRRRLGRLLRATDAVTAPHELAAAIDDLRSALRELERSAGSAGTAAEAAPAEAPDAPSDEAVRESERRFRTELRLAERTIRRQRRLEEELRRARELAEAESRAKSELLAATSHEVRNPLTTILGTTELLAATALTTEQRLYVELLEHAGDSLLALLNDLIDLSRVGTGRVELRSEGFDLLELVEDTLRLVAPRAPDLDLVCRIAPDVRERVVGDPGRLRQVLMNLAGNAAKFTERGEIAIDVARAEGADLLRFTVSDTGPGIAPDRLGSIFEPFAQDEAGRRRGGSGLGLSISKELVERMGGSIRVESEPGRGSSFSFTVRLREAAAAPSADPPDWQGRRALVVDDGASMRELLASALSGWGMRITAVADAAAALRELAAGSFDVLLVDARMPGEGGLELVSRLSPEIRRRTLLTLPLSHRDGDPGRMKALRLGGFVLKPLRLSELRAAVAAALGDGDEARATPSPPRPAAGAAPSLQVLLADDSSDNLALLLAHLRPLGCAVDAVGDGVDAVERFGSGDYDLVLIDYRMPRLDGRAAAANMRALERLEGRRPASIVALSGDGAGSGSDAESPFDEWLAKPLRRGTVRDLVRRVIARRREPTEAPEGSPAAPGGTPSPGGGSARA